MFFCFIFGEVFCFVALADFGCVGEDRFFSSMFLRPSIYAWAYAPLNANLQADGLTKRNKQLRSQLREWLADPMVTLKDVADGQRLDPLDGERIGEASHPGPPLDADVRAQLMRMAPWSDDEQTPPRSEDLSDSSDELHVEALINLLSFFLLKVFVHGPFDGIGEFW